MLSPQQQRKKSDFILDERILNKWEQTDEHFPVNFHSALSLKKYMDSWINDGKDDNYKSWDMKKNTKFAKVWIRWKGTEIDPDYPIIRAEHYFPDIDDPKIVIACLNEMKQEWDQSQHSQDEVTEFRSKNCYIVSIKMKSVLGTS